ncbi:hypothetical protein SCHPADRAFT_891830 [Schizopora paradoxa]|uniref:BTB domain-containing protein n=1 Tax=Schizopora paradoxa TaxID=27342 RepID=A0A0H2RNS7_9AGAM|nr:hypothetical protein SCHPADRAFT_891830 [Schizopora paradoxa]
MSLMIFPSESPKLDSESGEEEVDFTERFISVANGGYSKYKHAGQGSDLVLKSSDNFVFHVHTPILMMSSSVFKDMIDMPSPQPSENPKLSTTEPEPVELSEPAEVLLILLDTIYPGRGLLQDVDFGDRLSLLEAVGVAAKKYDMWSALEGVRAFLICSSNIAKYSPIHLYVIAYEMQFYSEAKSLSTKTLECNLLDPKLENLLVKANALAIFKLFQLRHRRKCL